MNKDMGTRILAALELRGMSQRELAYRTGTTECSISRYCSNKRTPKMDTAFKIAEALGVTLDYLAGLTKGIKTI